MGEWVRVYVCSVCFAECDMFSNPITEAVCTRVLAMQLITQLQPTRQELLTYSLFEVL